MQQNKGYIILSLVFVLLLSSCFSDYTPIPKPKAYFNIELPEKAYQKSSLDACPFEFEYPTYGEIKKKEIYFADQLDEPCWFNIEFDQFNATLYFSYKELTKEIGIDSVLADTRNLTWHHTVKAEYIDERAIDNGDNVYGVYYNVGGNAASSVQFYLTDSTDHFLRASLYFKNTPNIDSVQDVLSFLEQDIQYLIQTVEWK